MEVERSEKEMVVTQISVGEFEDFVTAKMLLDYFEEKIGLVWRCRLKTSSTPPESHPIFVVDPAKIQIMNDYPRVEPHAFVHFIHPDSAKLALDAAGRGQLVFLGRKLKVCLGPENPHSLNQRRRETDPYTIPNVGVEAGIFASRVEFFVGWRGPPTEVDFIVDSFDGKCKILFTKDTVFSIKDTAKHAVIKCNFKVEFIVREIHWVRKYDDLSSIIIILQLSSSPSLFYRTADDDIEEPDSYHLLDDDDPWTRTTDFTPSGAMGRCNTFRISVPPRYGMRVKNAMEYLKRQRVPESFDTYKYRVVDEPDFGSPTMDHFFCIHYKDGISFQIMYLINVALHKHVINQHQLSDEFFKLLKNRSEDVNMVALKHLCSYKKPVFDAFRRLKLVQEWVLKNPKLLKSPKQLDEVVEVRRLVITPTKAYCLPPTVELSNRVLRQYRDIADRFIRVAFMDEGMQTLNSSLLNSYTAPILKLMSSNSYQQQKTAVFKRIKTILNEGFHLCGRKYTFLGFSPNQLRDRSAWFFAEVKGITVHDIRGWMGKFQDRNVAKCAARMGQCFSSTYATVEVPRNQVNLELIDIKRNGYTFSDGIGKITPDLALEVAEKLKLRENPSAYQIRYAGCKGVVACWPGEKNGCRLSLRRSMIKFESDHTVLEICSWTRFQPGFLNRQIVTLLSTLKVSDEVFMNMQISMVSKLDKMIVDTDVAFDVLTASCAEQGNTAAIMLSAGFKPQTEPHLRGMLSCVRAAQLWALREKARIFVPLGRWLMGCLDELAVLKQGQCFIQVSTPSLENCFANHGSKFSGTRKNLQVVEGYVVIAKNPCLHPGDIRVLEAVNAPGLSHLFDCLVFPQNGVRPHTNEASGSDLDGDLYFVTWEEKLIPPSKTSAEPMDYTPAEETKLPRNVTQKDIINFFTKSIVNENLGAICNAHVVHADLSEYGALDKKCTDLAARAARAVDFPKTGFSVTLPSDLKPKMYPDFMGKEKWQSYKSKKILGQLYRKISDIDEKDNLSMSELTLDQGSVLYDVNLEIPGSEEFLDEAWKYKCFYDDQLLGLLGQYKVNNEAEVVTGQIWSMPKHNSRKRGDLEEKLKHAYKSLRKEYRQVFEKIGSDFEKFSEIEKNNKYEQKASAWYQVNYHPEWVKKALDLLEPCDGASGVESLLFSFSWIAVDYLARIKIRARGAANLDNNKPINKLVKYIADRV